MSWAAHQFEGYVLQKHFGSKVRISYLAIVAGDLLPDKFVKSWVYGFTIEWGKEFQPPYAEMQKIMQEISAALLDFCLGALARRRGYLQVFPTYSSIFQNFTLLPLVWWQARYARLRAAPKIY